MKNIAFSICFSLLATITFGQKRASLEVSGSAIFADYTNKISSYDSRLSYDFGIGFTIPTKWKRSEWVFGARLTTYGTKYNSGQLTWGTQHNGQGGIDPNIPAPSDIKTVDFRDSYFYIDLPVSLRQYLFDGEKLKLFAQAGVGPSFYLASHSQQTKHFTDGSSEASLTTINDSSLRGMNATAGFGLGASVSLGRKISLMLQPHGQLQLLSVTPNTTTGSKWYAYGIRAGFQYHFF